MKRQLTIAGCAALLILGARAFPGAQTPPVADGPTAVSDAMLSDSTDLWFVELSSPPTAEGTSDLAVKGEKDAFREAAAKAGLKYKERYAFDGLWNGVSVRINPADLESLRAIQGVQALYPVIKITAPTPEPGGSGLDLSSALGMTGADIAQSALGLTGAGIRVGVIDTGIDYDHPDLGGCFGKGCRVAYGYDFVGDAYDSSSANPANWVPVPDQDPDDCNGHGTHVSGIIGANGGVKGVAPGVTYGAYRVFGCTGTTDADVMLAAMEMAHKDKMDVVNMSIGSAFQWPQYPTAQGADRLVKKHVVVVTSAGNSGANGLYASSAPGTGERVISTASFENVAITLPYFTVSPDDTKIGYSTAAASPPAPTNGTYSMARTGTPTTANDACSPLPAGSLAGQVVLIRRGTCGFYNKALNAQNAGAAGVVLYNNSAGRFNPTVAGTPAITIPVVAVSDTEGVLINNRIAAGPTTMTWTDQTAKFPNPTGGLISSTSSYGPSPDLALKPDIGAPGGFIYSTYPLALGGYANLSGTSMASPHVAGAVALLLEARPKTKTEDVRDILQNSADPRPWWGNPGLGFLDNVHRQGAGMLDVDDAILSTTIVTPGKLALGESAYEGKGPAKPEKIEVENDGDADVTYVLSHEPALATGPNTFAPSFLLAPATVTFKQPSVKVKKNHKEKVEFTVEPNAGLADRSLYGGYIVLTPEGGGRVYRVPYVGFKGDYQSIPVLVPTANNFPWLARLVGSSYVNQPAGATFSLAGGDVPYILVHLDHQVRELYAEIQDAATGEPVHKELNRAFEIDYVGRNSTATSFFALPWSGDRISSKGKDPKTEAVPDGSYKLVLKALKALGDKKNPAHWETWTSPVIILDRP